MHSAQAAWTSWAKHHLDTPPKFVTWMGGAWRRVPSRRSQQGKWPIGLQRSGPTGLIIQPTLVQAPSTRWSLWGRPYGPNRRSRPTELMEVLPLIDTIWCLWLCVFLSDCVCPVGDVQCPRARELPRYPQSWGGWIHRQTAYEILPSASSSAESSARPAWSLILTWVSVCPSVCLSVCGLVLYSCDSDMCN